MERQPCDRHQRPRRNSRNSESPERQRSHRCAGTGERTAQVDIAASGRRLNTSRNWGINRHSFRSPRSSSGRWRNSSHPTAPEMARVYRAQVTALPEALQEPDSPSEATDALRGLVDAIVLTPDRAGETPQIELRGHLAAMLGRPYKRRGLGIRRPPL